MGKYYARAHLLQVAQGPGHVGDSSCPKCISAFTLEPASRNMLSKAGIVICAGQHTEAALPAQRWVTDAQPDADAFPVS